MSEHAHDVIAAQSGGLGVMDVLSKSLRAMFTAKPGYVLVGADFSNIEGRLNAWFAGEDWKLRAFREYDAGTGPDLYKLAYARSFDVDVDAVTKAQRQAVGKPQELACGFQGSVGAFLRFVGDVRPLVKVVTDTTFGGDAWRKAAAQHDQLKFHNGLGPEQWIAIKVLVNLWRETNPAITSMWWTMQDSVIEAVEAPGTTVTICGGKLSYLVTDGFLWTRLPSGKLLAYAQPRLVEKKDDWLVDEEGNAVPADEMTADEIEMRVAAGAVLQEGKRRLQVAYFGKNQKTNSWGKQYLYGGVLTNNAIQGTARELLRHAMMQVEAEGYPIVLHCHDEAVSEVPEGLADAALTCYGRVMSTVPSWLWGLPLAAKAWQDRRYVK